MWWSDQPLSALCAAQLAVCSQPSSVRSYRARVERGEFFARPVTKAAGTLGAAAAEKGRYFGAAVAANHLGEAPYASTLNTEFNIGHAGERDEVGRGRADPQLSSPTAPPTRSSATPRAGA
jgi:hypothetical protein